MGMKVAAQFDKVISRVKDVEDLAEGSSWVVEEWISLEITETVFKRGFNVVYDYIQNIIPLKITETEKNFTNQY